MPRAQSAREKTIPGFSPEKFAQGAEHSAAASSLREVLMLGAISCAVFLAVVTRFDGYSHKVLHFGDNPGYLNVAEAIRHWNFSGLTIKQFWGLPFSITAVSLSTGISTFHALLLICFLCYFASLILAHRLWGGSVAGVVAVLNFYWLQVSFLGGSEPLFVALLYASFLATRRDRWPLAALLGSLATIVRPLGFLAPLSFGLVLLWRRDYRRLIYVTVITLCVAAAYMVALRSAVGDPLATVHSYTSEEPSPPPFGVPFYALAKGALSPATPVTNLILSLGWVGFIVLGMVRFLRDLKKSAYWASNPAEVLFSIGYLAMICCYNAPYWALGNFARFAIPVVPFATLGWLPQMPKSRWFLRVLAVISPALAACSSIGITEVMHRLRS